MSIQHDIPEENFITAILTQAVEDASYKGKSKKYLKHKRDAVHWILSNDPECQNYCKMLGLDPNTIRNKIINNVDMAFTKQQEMKLQEKRI